ncbi:hypothetical protein BsWGS_15157 [Bradybaena similaris]
MIKTLIKDVDFRLTLAQLKTDDDTHIKELYLFFRKHVLKLRSPTSHNEFGGGDFLSKDSIDFLKKTLISQPGLGDSVLKSLMTEEDAADSRSNELLQGVYLDSVNFWIDKLEGKDKHGSSADDVVRYVDSALHILAFYSPVPYWNYLQLRLLFTRLLTLTLSRSAPSLSPERIVSVICGRQVPYLLDEFCKIYQEVVQTTIAKSISEHSDFLSDSHWQCLHMMNQLDRSVCWRDFYIACYRRGAHFLAEILDASLSLVRSGKFTELQNLLSYLELQPLRPVVLLMGWSYCTTSTSARTLLDTLWDDSAEGYNPQLANGCRRLAYHLDLLQWCLDRAKPLVEGPGLSYNRQATGLLQGLETQSVLYMLHQSTSLACLDHSEVLQLLTSTATSTKKGSKKKVVTFQDESKTAENPAEPINIDQQKDIAIYRSYCAVKNVMDVVMFCVHNSDHELMNPIQVRKTLRARKLHKNFTTEQSFSSSEGEDSSNGGDVCSSESERAKQKENSQQFVKLYDQMVTLKLKETRGHLAQLQPLNYRLEVLENIFSLLFVTHKQLCDANGFAELEPDEDNEGSKQGSSDNLPLESSILSEEDSAYDEQALEKSRQAKPAERSTSSSPTMGISRGASLDYDEPFIDRYQKLHDSLPLSEPPQSSYFTTSREIQNRASEFKKPVFEILKQARRESLQPSKKPRKRKKRLDSEPSSDMIVGFLCNEYIVRDILHLLKDALSDLNIAKFALTGKTSDVAKRDISRTPKSKQPSAASMDVNLEHILQVHIPASIPVESLLKRITKLTQAVHEAWWRFQLIAHEAFPRQPSQILPEKVFVTDNDINALPVCEGSAAGADTDMDTYLPGMSSKLSRCPTVLSHSNIMSRMMASPESLLVFSLIRDNPSQAAEVIKLFKLTEKTAETCEVSFAQVYQTVSGKIWDLEPEVREPAQVQTKVGKRSITALNKAAAVGVATAYLSNIVEDLLANPCVPPVPKPSSCSQREYYSSVFNLDPSSALMLDILCTCCRTWDTCSNMLDIIKTKTKLLKQDPRHKDHVTLAGDRLNDSPDSSETRESMSPDLPSASVAPPFTSAAKTKNLKSSLLGVMGCSELLWHLYDLIHLGESAPMSAGSRTVYPSVAVKVGLQHHFHSAYSSLQVDNLRSLDIAVAELKRALDHVLQVLGGVSLDHLLDVVVDDAASSQSPSPRGSLSGSMSGSISGSITSQGGTAGPGSRTRAKHQTDDNPLHLAVKQLMYVMEKYVPGDGLTHILLGKPSKLNSPPMKNFLLSLYEHVKEMSYLVAECEGKSTDVASNYFKVLNEGPISILGRLMFVKKMPPARLEAVAAKLSLNLTHTIVHSCCPRIPSKHPPAVPECGADVSVRMPTTRVYNVQTADRETQLKLPGKNSVLDDTLQTPEKLVTTLLGNLIKLMEDVSIKQNANGIFDLSCAERLVQLPEYNQAMLGVSRLKDADLTQLATEEERLCFFGNLANLMILHCHLSHIETRLQIYQKSDTREVIVENVDVELCPLGAADYIAYFSSFSYEVGQLGIVSVFDLLTTLCCNELAPSGQWKHILGCRKLVLSPDDPWKVFCPLAEPRFIFILNLGCMSSPPLQVLQPDQVWTQLERSMKQYLSHTVIISPEQERILLPELLVWYKKYFVEDADCSRETQHASLVRYVAQHLSGEKQRQLQQFFHLDSVRGFSENIDASGHNELSFNVDIDRFDNGFCVTFDISFTKVGHINPARTVTSTEKLRAPVYRLSSSVDRSGQGWSLELPSYKLTPVTLDYVKQNSLLVATMVSLVCSDNLDNIEQHFTADHFNMSESVSDSGNLSRMYPSVFGSHQSDINLVDIRSYRYHRLTDDYPILQRHLLHYILPLAGADNPELLTSTEPILKFVTNEIDGQVKLCMFSLPTSDQFQCVIQDMANRLLEEQKWLEVFNIIKSLPETVVTERLHLQVLHDFVLSCWAISQVGKPGFAPKVGDRLRKFYNRDVQARTVLTVCHTLPLDLCIDLLDLCMTSLNENSGLWKAINVKYQEASVYSKITDCVKTLRIKQSMRDVPVVHMSSEEQHLHKLLEKFTDWRLIPRASQEQPGDVLLLLEKAGDFATARAWAAVHKLPQDILKDIELRHVSHLLTQDQPDTVTAFQLLDKLRLGSRTQCLSVCQALADRLTRPRDIKFVLGYMLQFLSQNLPAEDVENLRLQRIGAKALMCLPASAQGQYMHLLSCPHLILEQLIMNMKAELAGQIFEQIKGDYIEIKEHKLRLVQDQFNQLLATYANKAVEVNVVHVVDKPQAENSGTISGHLEDGNMTGSPSRRFSIDRRKNNLSASPSPSLRQEVANKSTAKHLRSERGKFVMPAQPPSQDQWVVDSATSVCMVCRLERFSMFSRRHHCRRCGRVVCAACSAKQTMVLGVLARTCDECYEQINSSSEHRAQEEHEIYSQKIKEQLAGSRSSPSNTVSGSPVQTSALAPDRLKQSMASAIHHVNHDWKLHPDVAYNDRVRSEFYYEQAPSVSLSISLLKQHSSRAEAGKLILSMCDQLSTYLVPISPGVPNPEIDYSLIISVMKQLLFQAKLDFLHAGNTGLTELCEVYLGRVDLLNVMVKANYQDLPTIQELTKQDSVRRLRDKLIADERLSLAMEVSTKCGIDPSGVWSALGFACLHLGDFIAARDKFAHCLKVPADKNQTSASQSRLLGEILEFLDTIPSSGFTEVQRLLSDPGSICDITTLLIPSVGEENRVESVPYQECLYYLRTYGSYMDHICFLRQHSYWMKAVQFAVDHHCSSDIFVHGLMVPAMNSGEMSRLLEQMLMLDPTLEKWTAYLMATCKHLLKQKYFNTLYHMQIFMKDYIRAAMTCITHFYQRGATSYLDLIGRLQFLITAQHHLEAYLDPGQWGSVRHPLAASAPPTTHKQAPNWDKQLPESSARMTLSPEEVKKHIRTISLQIEVTKFLEQCLTQSLGVAGANSTQFLPRSSSTQISTLFGPGSARTELVSMVVLSGSNFSAGFDLGVRIVRECRLNPSLIFTHCSRELAKQGRFSDISSLIQSLLREGLVDDDGIDEIVGASLLVIADSHSQAQDESDALIQLLRNDSNKINAYILCGKLRSAYLLAVKRDRVDDVQRIAGAAQRLGQSAVKNICKKWLEQHQK